MSGQTKALEINNERICKGEESRTDMIVDRTGANIRPKLMDELERSGLRQRRSLLYMPNEYKNGDSGNQAYVNFNSAKDNQHLEGTLRDKMESGDTRKFIESFAISYSFVQGHKALARKYELGIANN